MMVMMLLDDETMVHDNRDHSDENNKGHCHLYCDGYDYCDDVNDHDCDYDDVDDMSK